jgi:hypothetical protein
MAAHHSHAPTEPKPPVTFFRSGAFCLPGQRDCSGFVPGASINCPASRRSSPRASLRSRLGGMTPSAFADFPGGSAGVIGLYQAAHPRQARGQVRVAQLALPSRRVAGTEGWGCPGRSAPGRPSIRDGGTCSPPYFFSFSPNNSAAFARKRRSCASAGRFLSANSTARPYHWRACSLLPTCQWAMAR